VITRTTDTIGAQVFTMKNAVGQKKWNKSPKEVKN
jgi:hypothetical protein